MLTYRQSVIDFYKNTDYLSLRNAYPRPSEWHFPKLIYDNFNGNYDFFKNYANGNKIDIPLKIEDMEHIRATLLHESLFSFYKSFYNYLAAKNLYLSGAIHWINITNYYAKLYLARAINTLCGIQSYRISSDKFIFIQEVFKVLKPKKYQALVDKYKPNKINFKSDIVSYSMHLTLDIKNKTGKLEFDDRKINTHDDIWRKYSYLDHEGLGLTKLTYDEYGEYSYNHLSQDRNEENYTFDGYKQIDFNLFNDNFYQYFNRDYIKKEASLVYDDIVAITLGVFTELYHLYDELNIDGLPIEIEKFEHMCNYMVQDEILKTKLIDLCRNKFPIHNKYIEEMNL